MASIKLPDGSVKELAEGTTVLQLAESIGKRLAQAAIAARVDGKLVDLAHPLSGQHEVQIITERDPEGLQVLRHSSAHVMAQALRHLYGKDVQYTIGPVVDSGFYYDVQLPHPLSVEELAKIEAEMQKIVNQQLPFQREDVPADVAKDRLHGENQRFKDEIISELVQAGEKSVSLYKQGDFLDLCRGPHLPHTGKIKAFKLLNIAGAYWRGDANREQLTRIYGTAFFDKKQLEEHLKMLEEAKKRDHRFLGPQLGLFTIDEKVGQGLVLWKPKGAIVRNELQKFISEHLRRQGYSQVYTPHIGRLDLYKTSGHFPYYRESQFPPLIDREQIDELAKEGVGCAELANRLAKGDIDGYLLKPMNCPHHIRIYASDPHSYRDLPVRLAEFGTVYRWEKSGELGGMTRVRGFTQDDAHLFVTEDQLPAEVAGCLELVKIVLGTLGMNQYRVRVGLRDPDSAKYVGDPAQWDKAEKACKDAAASLGVPFTAEPGEAAFYGPKIDFVVKDVLGREWQLGTVQVDYQLPQRFDLSYIGADNQPHRPVMIHRAPFGSMERFIGVLIEHFAGAFPLWLAPVQVAVLSISEKFNDYANQVGKALFDAGLRVEMSLGSEKIGAKIRQATLQKIPYMLILGEKEQQARVVAVRTRSGGDQGQVPLEQFIGQAQEEAATRSQSSR
ncbi:MAG TPA: threonine--tRNA ligase [Tepidisphaeraceae bacterium]|nr:threonine--tRNA ligase [Tepidisphaeraceae bacterium]